MWEFCARAPFAKLADEGGRGARSAQNERRDRATNDRHGHQHERSGMEVIAHEKVPRLDEITLAAPVEGNLKQSFSSGSSACPFCAILVR
jgi:hypothetical protein